MADFVVTQIGEVTQFNDLAAGRIQLVQRAMNLSDLLGGHELGVWTGGGRGGIQREAVLRFFGIERNGGLAAAAFGGIAAFAIIPRFICGDSEKPGLKLAAALK